MSFTVEPLPYAKDALAPHISAETLEFHYEKHHKGYLTKLNEIAATNKDVASKSLEELVKTEKGKVFNLAAQVWNHTFYWKSMSPNGGGVPSGRIGAAIDKSFGSFDNFKKQFNDAAANHFGSGWAWLVRDDQNNLKIVDTHDAGNPLTQGQTPVLTCDVWEHAYYIDYRNARPTYLESWWKVVNWQFAESNLASE